MNHRVSFCDSDYKSQKPQKPHGLYGIISQNSLNSNALVVYRLPTKRIIIEIFSVC